MGDRTSTDAFTGVAPPSASPPSPSSRCIAPRPGCSRGPLAGGRSSATGSGHTWRSGRPDHALIAVPASAWWRDGLSPPGCGGGEGEQQATGDRDCPDSNAHGAPPCQLSTRRRSAVDGARLPPRLPARRRAQYRRRTPREAAREIRHSATTRTARARAGRRAPPPVSSSA